MDSFAVLIASFAAYSCMGWLFESIFCSISEHRFINRGFLNGPVCPIYGAGAIAAVVLLGGIDDIPKLFCWGAIICSLIEYLTSWLMEKIFHARWWDYSDRFLNLNGRICVPATTLFGVFCVLVVRVIQPLFEVGFDAIDAQVLSGLCGVFLALFALDLLVTNMGLSRFRDKIDAYCAQLTEQAARVHDVITEGDNPVAEGVRQLKASPIARVYVRLRELMPGPVAIEDIGHSLAVSFSSALNAQERRVMDAFPRMRISVPRANQMRELANSAREKLLGMDED